MAVRMHQTKPTSHLCRRNNHHVRSRILTWIAWPRLQSHPVAGGPPELPPARHRPPCHFPRLLLQPLQWAPPQLPAWPLQEVNNPVSAGTSTGLFACGSYCRLPWKCPSWLVMCPCKLVPLEHRSRTALLPPREAWTQSTTPRWASAWAARRLPLSFAAALCFVRTSRSAARCAAAPDRPAASVT